ncbi:hypothetical protein IWQ56_001209 [Coemansia nantahalensis]|nr:hypothetical protein IWQ56_001209 [Coemansia nantahalensis]
MREPPPRRSKFSRYYISTDDVDYNMKSPLGGKIGYPCRNATAGPVMGTMVAGQDFKVFFDGTATRHGGDCQFAISYDNGTSFAVIWDKLDNCLLDTVNGGYEVPVPDRLPAAKSAVLAWTWVPSTGSRPYYMNCVDVRIENYGKQEAYTGKELLVVNVPGKPSVAPVQQRAKDTLPSLLDSRPMITVGTPAQSGAGGTPQSDEQQQRQQGEEVKEDSGGDSSSGESGVEDSNAGDSGGGTMVMYVSESTTTTTNVVVVNEYITEDDTNVNALYTFGYGIQTQGQPSVTLGPYAKPLFGSNVGLTIAPDAAATSAGEVGGIFFTGDWPAATEVGASAKETATDSVDYIVPSLAPPPGQSGTGATSISVDLWPSGSQNADPAYPAGTPLFASTGAAASLGGGATVPAFTTNRPSFKSVTDQAQLNMLSGHHAFAAMHPHAVTKFNTVTVNGKPMLQVVVSADNTAALPASLTISY